MAEIRFNIGAGTEGFDQAIRDILDAVAALQGGAETYVPFKEALLNRMSEAEPLSALREAYNYMDAAICVAHNAIVGLAIYMAHDPETEDFNAALDQVRLAIGDSGIDV